MNENDVCLKGEPARGSVGDIGVESGVDRLFGLWADMYKPVAASSNCCLQCHATRPIPEFSEIST